MSKSARNGEAERRWVLWFDVSKGLDGIGEW